MNSPANVTPARLFTTHGTVLYVNDSGELRHGPIESSPANAMFVGIDSPSGPHRSGSIAHFLGDTQEPVVCSAESCGAISGLRERPQSPNAVTLELIALERGLIALKAEKRFLCAEPGGRVVLSRAVCGAWECFLASEPWCSASDWDALPPISAKQTQFDVPGIKRFNLNPSLRVAMNCAAVSKKVLAYGYPGWSRGRAYYDLSKQLHGRGYIVDILNWQQDHSGYMGRIVSYYNWILTAANGVPSLIDSYGVPPEKMIVVTHDEADIRFLRETNGADIFDRFAAYGAVSYSIYCASMMQGIRRPPQLVPLGIDYAEFYDEVPTRLESVGYASSMSLMMDGIELKRGGLAEAAVQEAGLPFKVAGSTAQPLSFHDMPSFYSSVNAVLMSSLSEGGPLPVMEAAAAGRLVIGTPVGDFPLKAYQGGGVIAPIEPEKFVAVAAETLKHYKNDPADLVFKCLAIQEAARQYDWKYYIDDWVDFIAGAQT